MEMLDTHQELFEHELRDIYDAEHKLVRALRTMAKKVPDKALSEALVEHRRVTQGQVKRLEEVFRLLDRKPRREPCRGINGLINEFTKFANQEESSEEILNAFAISAGLKVEQYEIAAYQTLLRLASQLDLHEELALLAENLSEEIEAAHQLEALAEQFAGPLTSVPDVSHEPVILPEVTEQIVLDEEAEAHTAPSDRPL
jgi:ferritin-like metal-binding protein YciE